MNRRRTRSALSLVGGVALLAATLSVAQSASAHESAHRTQTARHAVFVATNDATGNQVIAYARGTDGKLAEKARYATGGAGGRLDGPVFDPLASQGSLSFDAEHGLLYAANAGSDTVTVFAVHGSSLTRLQVLPTQGHIPLSVGFAENVVYVLNAGGDGSITGFVVDDGRLRPIPGSTRSLNLGNPTIPFHLNAPGQVAVTPDAKDVIVTTKLHNQIIVFPLGRGQRPEAPVVTASAAPVPFAVSFDASGRLLVGHGQGLPLHRQRRNQHGDRLSRGPARGPEPRRRLRGHRDHGARPDRRRREQQRPVPLPAARAVDRRRDHRRVRSRR